MTRDEMFRLASKMADAATAEAGNRGDAKQALHMAITLIHNDESEARIAVRQAGADHPAIPRKGERGFR